MLESMRNQAQSWIAKFILGGIALSFVLWGVGDYFLGSRLEPVAEVDGKPITDAEFAQAFRRQVDSYRAMLGAQFSKDMIEALHLKDETLQILINRRLMLAEAGKLGLRAPEALVLAEIRGNPAFQSAERFDPQRYRILIRNMGFRTPKDYETELRTAIVIDALQRAVGESAIVTPQELRDRFRRKNESRVIEAVLVDPNRLENRVALDRKSIEAWYEAHKVDYQSPLKLRAKAVVIDPAVIGKDIEIDAEEIAAWYEAHQGEFATPEERRARHILFRIPENADERTKAEIREKAVSALARLRKGEDFARLAKALSDDVTAKDGGDLGWFRQGVMVPAFDEAVFSMKKGEISDIVETPFGYHIIRLDDIRKAGVKPLEEVRDQIAERLRKERAAEEAWKLSQDLDDALGREDGLEEAARAVDLPVTEIGPISERQAMLDPIVADPAVRAKAFATTPDQPVEIVETEDGRFVAVEVVERIAPAPLPLAEVIERVRQDALQAKAREAAQSEAQAILAEADEGGDIDALAQRHGQPKLISKPVHVDGAGDTASWLTADLLKAAFDAEQGQWLPRVFEVPEGFVVARVARITPPDEKAFEAQKEAIAREVRKAKGAVRFARWMASVRDRHEIEIHEKTLDRF
ncbi:MAG: SurA N-terminal domain-containing protein [Mariprofundaceae bacterium]